MTQDTETVTGISEVEQACDHYLQQVRTLAPLDALTVVLLDASEDTGKVIFSWRHSPCGALPSYQRRLTGPSEPEQPSIMNITLYGSEGPIGGILLHTSVAEGFSQLHRRVAQDLSIQLAMRLENSQLNQRLQSTSREINLLDQVTHIFSRCSDLGEAFEPLVTAMGNTLEFDAVLLSWIDLNGYDIHTLESGNGPPGSGVLEAANPIVYCQQVIASLTVQRAEGPFSPSERALLELVCNQMAPAVHSARYHRSIKSQSPDQGDYTYGTPTFQEELRSSVEKRPEPVDLAHALCTPLTTIKGYANSLLQPGVDWPPEVQQEFLQTIDQAADRLGKVIRELLASHQPGSSTPTCQFVTTDLSDLLHGVESELYGETPGAPGQFRYQSALPVVSIDRHLIHRAIKHLIECSLDEIITGDTLLIEAVQSSNEPVISITICRRNHQACRNVPASIPQWNTNLRVVACRNILVAHGANLNIDTTTDGIVRFWFSLSPAESATQDGNGSA